MNQTPNSRHKSCLFESNKLVTTDSSNLPTGYGKSLLLQLLPGICRALNTMGYTTYSKKAIILVICPLNTLIESHMKELLHIAQFVSIPVLSDRLETRSSSIFFHLASLVSSAEQRKKVCMQPVTRYPSPATSHPLPATK